MSLPLVGILGFKARERGLEWTIVSVKGEEFFVGMYSGKSLVEENWAVRDWEMLGTKVMFGLGFGRVIEGVLRIVPGRGSPDWASW